MPDETPILELSQQTPNAKDFNAKVATELADQGRELSKPSTEITTLETTDALENLRAAAVKKKTEDAAAKAADDAEGDAPVIQKKEGAKEASDGIVAPVKPDVATAGAPDKADDKPATDIFSGISLPSNIKPKSAEAFAAVKSKALEEISARDVRLADLEKKLAELEEKSKQPADENVLKELEEHRSWRSRLDVEADPKFKAYDKDIADNHAFIYSQLLKTGKITQENIDTIKKHGGPGKVHLEKVFELINDSHVQRVVESKIADEEMLRFKKEQAIKETKDNVVGYLKEREDAYHKAAKSHNDATQKQFTTLASKMEWTKDRTLPKDANDSVKAEVESHNKFVASTKKDLEAALQDDSPEMRAILLAGMGQLLNLQRVHETVNKELAVNKKLLEEANAKLEKIKGASRSRLPESSAPANAKVIETKKDDYNTSSGDAIEAIRKKIIAEKAAAAAAA